MDILDIITGNLPLIIAVIAMIGGYINLKNEVKYMEKEITEMKNNHNNLNQTIQQAVTTLTEIKNDLKWIKETFLNKK